MGISPPTPPLPKREREREGVIAGTRATAAFAIPQYAHTRARAWVCEKFAGIVQPQKNCYFGETRFRCPKILF